MFQIPYNCPITIIIMVIIIIIIIIIMVHCSKCFFLASIPLFLVSPSSQGSFIIIKFPPKLLFSSQSISSFIFPRCHQISTKALVFVTIKFPPSFFLIVIKFPPKLLLSSTCKSSQCNSSMVSSILVVAVIASFSKWRAPMKSCVYSGTVLKIISPPPLEI